MKTLLAVLVSLMLLVPLTLRESNADVVLPPVFGDHMVLQRDAILPVWGSAEPGERVVVRLGEDQRTATANATGRWRVSLPPRAASAVPTELHVTGQNAIVIRDVLVGEVWICAGQSNMEFALKSDVGATSELAKTHPAGFRLLNLTGAARGGSGKYAAVHLSRLTPEKFCSGSWQLCSAKSAGPFSAVGYYFGLKLLQELNVPVGIINPSIGGTPTEAWIDRAALAADPRLAPLVQGNWLDNELLSTFCRTRGRHNLGQALASGEAVPGDDLGPNHSFKPGFMWQAGIEPLIPFGIRGAIWYQGESNAESAGRVEQHEMLFPLLVRQWRKRWGQGDFPFLFVQLPGMGRPDWPEFREGQRRMLGSLTNVGMAVTLDVGHPTNVHPRVKKPVGERLARWALATTYGKSDVVRCGPLYRSMEFNDDSITLLFDHVKGGVTSADGKPLRHFEVAGGDGVFHAAVATIVGESVVVSSPKVPQPRRARYAWTPYPAPPVNFVNRSELPASPFATSDLSLSWNDLPDLPDAQGLGGPIVGSHNGALIVAGGANFPNGPPWSDGGRPPGAKVWHQRVFSIEAGDAAWKLSQLPRPLAYAAAVSTDEGIVILGGETFGPIGPNSAGQPPGIDNPSPRSNFPIADVRRISWNSKIKNLEFDHTDFPPLPKPCHYHNAAVIDGVIYVAASHAKDASSDRLDSKSFWSLDTAKPKNERSWTTLPAWPGPARHKMAVAVERPVTCRAPESKGPACLYLFSGSTWVKDSDGKLDLAKFEFFTDAYCYKPEDGQWRRIADLPVIHDRRKINTAGFSFDSTSRRWRRDETIESPRDEPVVVYAGQRRAAAASTAVGIGDGKILLCGGATGRYVTLDLPNRPMFPQDVLVYDTCSDRWEIGGQMPVGVVTTSAVQWNGGIVMPSGEIRPGVRTPKVQVLIKPRSDGKTRKKPTRTPAL